MDYLRLTWNDIDKSCSRISKVLLKRNISGYMFIGISRGGLVPLRLISDYLSIPGLFSMGIRFYDDIGKTLEEPEVFIPFKEDIRGKKAVLVDDVSDTGKSLIAAKGHLRDRGAKEILTVTICTKPKSLLTPDVFDFETSSWVIFPWEVQETMSKIIDRSENRGSASAELKKAGFTPDEFPEKGDKKY